MKRTLPVLLLLLISSACTGKKPEIWIYTSLYPEVIADLRPLVASVAKGFEIQWYQAGSETVMSRLNAEIAAGKTQADLLLTSDPFAYQELKEAGKLLPYSSPAAMPVPANLKDPDGAFVTVRLPVMVIGYNPNAVKPSPTSWHDLARMKDKVTMGSPLESGTNFTAVSLLSSVLGWDYFRSLRTAGILAAGGNSAALARMESQERPLGMVLLENILKARAKGSPVVAAFPKEGSVPVPSPIAIVKSTRDPEPIRRVYDWFFTPEAQALIVKGGMYSPLPGVAPPNGAPALAEVTLLPWNSEVLARGLKGREETKKKFTEIVLR